MASVLRAWIPIPPSDHSERPQSLDSASCRRPGVSPLCSATVLSACFTCAQIGAKLGVCLHLLRMRRVHSCASCACVRLLPNPLGKRACVRACVRVLLCACVRLLCIVACTHHPWRPCVAAAPTARVRADLARVRVCVRACAPVGERACVCV